MSTFGGKIQEIPSISVDRFDGENFESEAYFLSHCHSDHMRGLESRCFRQHLVENKKIIYASEISCAILTRMHPDIQNNLKELALNVPITIFLKDKTFSVTLIPAGHCPGSVMFLFENGVRILYTGDYRIRKNDIKKFEIFYDSFKKVKEIDKVYLDTTFFLKRYLNFPKREESLLEIIEIIKEWTDRGRFFYVNLLTSAKYGYEYVFNEIYDKLNMPVHVGDDAFRFYSIIPEMDKAVSLDGGITKIHSHCVGWRQTCIYDQDALVKTVKVSAFRWTQEDLNEGMSELESGIHYVCYSTHASYEEGVALIRFLKPKQIEVCVKHNDPNINKEMTDLLEHHLQEFRTDFKPKEEKNALVHKLFEVKSVEKKCKIRKTSVDFLGVFSSPPRDNFKIPKSICGQGKSLDFSSKLKERTKIFESQPGQSSTSSDDGLSFLFATSAIKSNTTSSEVDNFEVKYDESEIILSQNKLEDNPDDILLNIINSKPQTVSSSQESVESLGNKVVSEEDRLLLDLI